MDAQPTYDVFLSHHSVDKPVVEELAKRLREAGLSVFLDSDCLVPGELWLRALEAELSASRSFVLCVGPSGLGRWTEQEVNIALVRATRDPSFTIIPVLLSGARRAQLEELSLFAQQYQAVDLRRGFEDDHRFEQFLSALQEAARGSSTWGRPRQGFLPGQIEGVLERLQGRFFESLRHHFAGEQLLRRKETQALLAQLDEEATRVVVVHGVAGSGKSGVLFELAQELADQGVPFLPLRLDRYELRGDPYRFGKEKLGLSDSPAKCLAAVAGEKSGVLLLDQLDALRWTSAHSSEAWDVCREVISEALMSTASLKVVICCRTYDLEHDPQLRGWEQETKNLRRLEVGQLSPEEVGTAIQQAKEGLAPVLSPRERELLRHIHHLQMWLAIRRRAASASTFDTAWTLIEQFWTSRLDDLATDGVDRARAEELERRLVAAVQGGAVLSAPVRMLDMTERELKLYQDHHLLQMDERRIFTFCHQSYQDYLVAKALLRELDQTASEQGGRKVVDWLGPRENQSLFRREQLRLALVALRAHEHEAYLPALRALLTHPLSDRPSPVRFHLRLLALQSLGQVTEPRCEEVHLVLALLDQPFWREHVLGEVVRGQVPWFKVLYDQGKLEAWLAGENRQSALDILLYVVEKCGDQVAQLLVPYLEQDEDWMRRIIWVLRFDPSQDSDALFNLRLQLAKNGTYTADHVAWDKLAQSHPLRFVFLASDVLVALAASIVRGESRRRPGRSTAIDWYTLEKVGPALISRQHWSTAWEMLFRSVRLLAGLRSYPEEPQHIFESYAVDFDTLKPVLRLLKDLGRALLADNWLEFVTLGEELSREDRRAEVLFLDSLVEGPPLQELADWALGWLMVDPWRARLHLSRSSEEWGLAGRLLDRFAQVCSVETYMRLEQWLLTYAEADLLESYKRRHEWIGQGGNFREPSSFGRTPHALLPRLPAERRSAEANLRLGQLSRKFPIQPSRHEDEDGIKAGWVGSPLSESAKARMSDEDWLDIATNERLSVRFGKMTFRSNGRIEEASIETFATEFRSMAQRQPERFARLARRLAPTAATAFLGAILSGLAWPGDRNGQPQAESWNSPSHGVLEEVLALPTVQALVRSEDHEAARSLCRIFERYSEYPWSEGAIELLVWIAQHHEDPKGDYYPIGSSGKDSEDFDRLESNALNVTRGTAGFAIRALLFSQKALFASLRPALESLIRDEHPAVRVAALAACLPMINIDRDLAVDWFLEVCKGPDAILATREVRDVLRYTHRTHLDRLQPLIERMVASQLPRVATAGAAQVTACFLVTGQLEEKFEHCLSGTPPQRKGVAEVAASLLGEGEFAERSKLTLLRLAEDEDQYVAQAVARSFDKLDLQHIMSDRDAWNAFARSKAFQADPSPLLHALDRQAGKLLPFADCLLAVGKTFAEELAEASQNMATGIAADVRQLLPLLLRLYEQAQGHDQALYLKCLDLWDRLLERRVGAAMGLTKELDQV